MKCLTILIRKPGIEVKYLFFMVSWIPDSGAGDVWTWIALDPDTKLVPCWFIGQRDAGCAYHFMHDLKSRLANRVQLTTDGHRAYLTAVEDAFGCEIDFAMLQKIYGAPQDAPETRYSPVVCMGARKAISAAIQITATFPPAMSNGRI